MMNEQEVTKKQLQLRVKDTHQFFDDFMKTDDSRSGKDFVRQFLWRRFWDTLFRDHKPFYERKKIQTDSSGLHVIDTGSRLTVYERHLQNKAIAFDIDEKIYARALGVYRDVCNIRTVLIDEQVDWSTWKPDFSDPAELVLAVMNLGPDVFWDGKVDLRPVHIKGSQIKVDDGFGRKTRFRRFERRVGLYRHCGDRDLGKFFGSLQISPFPFVAIFNFEHNKEQNPARVLFSLDRMVLGVERNEDLGVEQVKELIRQNMVPGHHPRWAEIKQEKERRMKLRFLHNTTVTFVPRSANREYTGTLVVLPPHKTKKRFSYVIKNSHELVVKSGFKSFFCCGSTQPGDEYEHLEVFDESEVDIEDLFRVNVLDEQWRAEQNKYRVQKLEHLPSVLSYRFYLDIYRNGPYFTKSKLMLTLEETEGAQHTLYQELFGDDNKCRGLLDKLYETMDLWEEKTDAECYWFKTFVAVAQANFVGTLKTHSAEDHHIIPDPYNYDKGSSLSWRPSRRGKLEKLVTRNPLSFPVDCAPFQKFLDCLYARLHQLDVYDKRWKPKHTNTKTTNSAIDTAAYADGKEEDTECNVGTDDDVGRSDEEIDYYHGGKGRAPHRAGRGKGKVKGKVATAIDAQDYTVSGSEAHDGLEYGDDHYYNDTDRHRNGDSYNMENDNYNEREKRKKETRINNDEMDDTYVGGNNAGGDYNDGDAYGDYGSENDGDGRDHHRHADMGDGYAENDVNADDHAGVQGVDNHDDTVKEEERRRKKKKKKKEKEREREREREIRRRMKKEDKEIEKKKARKKAAKKKEKILEQQQYKFKKAKDPLGCRSICAPTIGSGQDDGSIPQSLGKQKKRSKRKEKRDKGRARERKGKGEGDSWFGLLF